MNEIMPGIGMSMSRADFCLPSSPNSTKTYRPDMLANVGQTFRYDARSSKCNADVRFIKIFLASYSVDG